MVRTNGPRSHFYNSRLTTYGIFLEACFNAFAIFADIVEWCMPRALVVGILCSLASDTLLGVITWLVIGVIFVALSRALSTNHGFGSGEDVIMFLMAAFFWGGIVGTVRMVWSLYSPQTSLHYWVLGLSFVVGVIAGFSEKIWERVSPAFGREVAGPREWIFSKTYAVKWAAFAYLAYFWFHMMPA